MIADMTLSCEDDSATYRTTFAYAVTCMIICKPSFFPPSLTSPSLPSYAPCPARSTCTSETITAPVSTAPAVPIGIPLGGGMLLFLRRNEIQNRTTRLGGSELEALSFFFKAYSPKFYWWAIIDMIRRLVPAFLLLFEYTSTQISVALILSYLFAVSSRGVQLG